MKKLVLILSACIFFLAACEDNGSNDIETTDGTAESKDREAYRIDVEREINALQVQLDSLDRRMERAGAKTKAEWQETRSILRERLNRAKADLDEFGNKTGNEWNAFRARVKGNLDTLRMKTDSVNNGVNR